MISIRLQKDFGLVMILVQRVYKTYENNCCDCGKVLRFVQTLKVTIHNTLVGNSNDPPRKNSESLYCIISYTVVS